MRKKREETTGIASQTNCTDRKHRETVSDAIAELSHLYTAWLAILLKRQGQTEIRIHVGDVQTALSGFACRVSKEGDTYVIRLTTPVPAEQEEQV